MVVACWVVGRLDSSLTGPSSGPSAVETILALSSTISVTVFSPIQTLHMADARFAWDERFAGEDAAESSQAGAAPARPPSDGYTDSGGEEQEEGEDAPTQTVQPLTREALAAAQAAAARTGVVYISRIPPGMQPAKVKYLMQQYGEIGRVYLQREGVHYPLSSPRSVALILSTYLIRSQASISAQEAHVHEESAVHGGLG